jgi:hypothetical protein
MNRDRIAGARGLGFIAFLRPYRYVLYHLLSRMESRNASLPRFRALVVMELVVFLNVAWVVFIGIILAGIPLDRLAVSRIEAFPLLAVYFLVFYVVADAAWISNGKLQVLRREFDGACPNQERLRRVMFWPYAVVSIAALPLTGALVHALHS